MEQPIKSCHVIAMPFPGRGHINPMMNFCKLLASKKDDILITFVLTEEWLGFLSSEAMPPPQIRFATIPNVIPSEIGRSADHAGFIEATMTKLEEPFQQLLDHIEPPRPTVIVYDAFLGWVVGVGNRQNIPVAPFWTQSSSVLTVLLHFHLLQENGHSSADDVSRRGNEILDYIHGLPPTKLADLPAIGYGPLQKCLPRIFEAMSMLPKAQHLLLTSTYELESDVIDALKTTVPIPIYTIGPAIPHFTINCDNNVINDLTTQWLDAQPISSVLYISQGSFLSVSRAQMDEIIAGVNSSGIRFMWVAGGAVSQIKDRFCAAGGGGGERGLVVRWSDQLKVLCHPAVGGFWSHCGWNSTKEGVYAGLPFLTYPIIWDQIPNSKAIVEDWKTGWKVRKGMGTEESLVTREEIVGMLQRFMDSGDEKGKEMRTRAKKLQEICQQATSRGGSVEVDIDAFIQEISQ